MSKHGQDYIETYKPRRDRMEQFRKAPDYDPLIDGVIAFCITAAIILAAALFVRHVLMAY